jgi:hypothetical protein
MFVILPVQPGAGPTAELRLAVSQMPQPHRDCDCGCCAWLAVEAPACAIQRAQSMASGGSCFGSQTARVQTAQVLTACQGNCNQRAFLLAAFTNLERATASASVFASFSSLHLSISPSLHLSISRCSVLRASPFCRLRRHSPLSPVRSPFFPALREPCGAQACEHLCLCVWRSPQASKQWHRLGKGRRIRSASSKGGSLISQTLQLCPLCSLERLAQPPRIAF